MNNYKEKLNQAIDIAKHRPILTGSIALLGLSLYVLKKQHYKFVVHPGKRIIS